MCGRARNKNFLTEGGGLKMHFNNTIKNCEAKFWEGAKIREGANIGGSQVNI